MRRFDWRPVSHPAFWAALALLLVNDNLLKGTGRVPGWLTGKLSDFAFLIVAPCVLGALLPVALRGRRLLAAGAVAAVYTAADLSHSVSDAIVHAAAWLGMRWRLWPDVTDLLALAVLPVAWRLLRTTASSGVRPRRAPGLVVGALACLATSAIHAPRFPFLVNRTASNAEVRLTWVLRRLDCATPMPELAASLTAGDLGEAHPVTLASGQVAALDAPPPAGGALAGVCSQLRRGDRGACVGVLIEAPGVPTTLARAEQSWEAYDGGSWCEDVPPETVCQPRLDPDAEPGEGGVSLVRDRGRLVLRASEEVQLLEIDRAAVEARQPPAGSCAATRDRLQALAAAPAPCTRDEDCGPAVTDQELPGGCVVHTNHAGAQEHARLAAAWRASCLPTSSRWCPVEVRVPACREGRCVDPCPDRACEPRCGHGQAPLLACAAGDADCRLEDGRRCRCIDGRWTCGPQPAGECAVTCFDRTRRAWPWDAGARD